MKKVEVFVVGAAKCGTTWLHHMLQQRKDVSVPEQKETNYFAFIGREINFSGPHDDENTNKHSVRDLQTYHSLFDGEDKLWLEVCPSYLYIKGTAENIRRYNPAAKIIIILRNPVDRAWSNYQHLVRDGAEDLSFEDALSLELQRSKAGWSYFWDIYQQGCYASQVADYLAQFPKESVYIAKFEDIHKDSKKFMRGVEGFIGLSPHEYHSEVEKNESGVPARGLGWMHKILFRPGPLNKFVRKMLPIKARKKIVARFKRAVLRKGFIQDEIRLNLIQRYRDDIKTLEKLVGQSFSDWMTDEDD